MTSTDIAEIAGCDTPKAVKELRQKWEREGTLTGDRKKLLDYRERQVR